MNKFLPLSEMAGVWTRNCQIHSDERGHFLEELRRASLPNEVPDFVQDSISFSKQNVLRGMHLQQNQWQLVTLLSGQIMDVVLNLDEDSSEFRQSASMSLAWNGTNQVLIRPGIAHGYAVISEDAIIHYKSSVYYGDTLQIGVHWRSNELINHWPAGDWTVSARDSLFQILKEKG